MFWIDGILSFFFFVWYFFFVSWLRFFLVNFDEGILIFECLFVCFFFGFWFLDNGGCSKGDDRSVEGSKSHESERLEIDRPPSERRIARRTYIVHDFSFSPASATVAQEIISPPLCLLS